MSAPPAWRTQSAPPNEALGFSYFFSSWRRGRRNSPARHGREGIEHRTGRGRQQARSISFARSKIISPSTRIRQRKPEIERALVKAAIEIKDDRRIVLYGERVLDREPGDPQILDRVTRALLATDAKDTSERALKYAKRYEEQVAGLRKQAPAGHFGAADWKMEVDRSVARAIVLEARATGNLGRYDEALALAEKSYAEFPTAEGAREIAKWLVKLGREQEAIPHLADAFTISDTRNTDAARTQDRMRMGELVQEAERIGERPRRSDSGILRPHDSTDWRAEIADSRASDPNNQATSLMEFTLRGIEWR